MISQCAQHVKGATRCYQDSESSLTDLMLNDYQDDITDLHYIPPLSKGDHTALVIGFHMTANDEYVSA